MAFTIAALFDVESLWAQGQAEGKRLYSTYCSACHGERGKGDGPLASSLPIKPMDHTDGRVMNQFSEKYLLDVITRGGTGVGKSPFMPPWGGQLKGKQLQDIVAFLRTLADPPYKAPGK